MIKWEYHTVTDRIDRFNDTTSVWSANTVKSMVWLANMGKEGWELVETINTGYTIIWIFKRKIEE